jgi:GMP synthase-like glutamine amidotransferase
MTALVITHTEAEGPGLLGSWLPEAGLGLHLVEPWRGDDLPPTLEGHRALVVMGGPQQAYDDSSATWLAHTKNLIRSAVEQGIPTLGVCLGAQLLADATGGQVKPGENGPELGAKLVGKRDAAGADPLFWDLPLSPVVVQWHWDAVTELPPGATLLMSSTAYPNQAFRVGERAWGMQFHIETDAAMVTRWVDHDRAALLDLEIDPDALLGRTVTELADVEEVWGEVARRFARLALER